MAARQERIWHFDVSDPTNHPKGFTIYKVTSKVFPINSPESLTEIVVWKRYNDFKNLYKAMSNLHKALHRRDELPVFAKPKLFGRFDEAVIEERRQSALELLNFIGLQSHLYKSQLFQKFLEGGRVLQGASGKVLKPSKLDILGADDSFQQTTDPCKPSADTVLNPVKPPETDDGSDKQLVQTVSMEESQGDNGNGVLEGVWNFPQLPENISLNSDEDTDATTDVDSALGTPLPETDISFFDPLSRDEYTAPPLMKTSKSWLLEAMNTCAEMEENGTQAPFHSESETLDEDAGLQMKVDDHVVSDDEISNSTTDTLARSLNSQKSSSTLDVSEFDPLSRSHSGSKVVYGKGDLDVSQITSGFQSGSSTSIESGSSTSSTPRKKPPQQIKRIGQSPLRQRSVTKESVSTMDLGGKEDYIYTAASQICMAQDYEANGNYEMAFAAYKNGVGILLRGVQGDQNKSRRDAVRRKTAQYLMKAEDLYNRHLSKDTSDDYRWAMDSKLTPTMELDPSLALIRGPASELKNFKVLGTIDKVVLVLDRSTDETFVIKRIYKSSTGGRNVPNVLPTSCPYMVNLHKFYETSSVIYLLLQYASGGKLWDYIGAYLQHAQNNSKESPGTAVAHFGAKQTKNIYMGLKVHDDDSKMSERKGSVEHRENFDINKGTNLEFSSLPDKASVKGDAISQGEGKLDDKVRFSKFSDDVQIGLGTSSANKQSHSHEPSAEVTEMGDNRAFSDSRFLNDSNIPLDEDSVTDVDSTQVAYKRYTSFSSEENQDLEMESIDFTPPTFERQSSHGAMFQDVLKKNKTTLENFSINSFDSADISVRLDSNQSDHIEIIPEVSETVCDKDDVFTGSENKSTNQNTDNKSLDLNKYSSEETVSPEPEDYLIKSARELLRSVDRTLSQVDSETSTRTTSISDNVDSALSLDSQPNTLPSSPQSMSNTAVSPDRDKSSGGCFNEPSIYDMTTTGDTSDSQSDSRSLTEVHVSQESTVDSNGTLLLRKGETGDPLSSEPPRVGSNQNGSAQSDSIVVRARNSSGSLEIRSRTSTMSDTNIPSVPKKLSLSRVNSRELSRSASTEYDFKSPSKSRQRTISRMFEQLDLSSASPDSVRIPESFIKRWAAEIIVALSRLHSLGIICRELNPHNILLGDQGHATLTYFCQINNAEDGLDFEAVEDLYVAPEVRSISGYTEVCDWWSLGALLYELLVGRSLSSCHPGGITPHTQLYIPDHVSPEAKALLQELLHYSPRERLGSGINGVEEIKAHPFFFSVDWNSMEM